MSVSSPIRTHADYQKARRRVADLMVNTDRRSTDELELLSLLLEDFERRHHPIEAPTPLAAIRFRMDQAGLRPRDLEPYIGSRSRVSEVLSGTRPLSLDMIRALNRHLGIPAEVLIQEPAREDVARPAMPSAHALQKLRDLGLMKAKETFDAFMQRMFGPRHAEALLRKSRTERTNAKTDQAALSAWLAAVRYLADGVQVEKPKRRRKGKDAARRLAELSRAPDGPALARRQLREWGTILVTLDHLPGTYLDGAALCREDGVHVIAMTLRHDRLDNFWFTLLHEFCHVSEHLKNGTTLILDDLELKSGGDIEDEADAFAQEALIPMAIWSASVTPDLGSDEVAKIASEANVHPAIVAGRWQREHGDYRRFSKLLGRGEVRTQFNGRV